MVDDEVFVGRVVNQILTQAGYSTLLATSGEEALRLADNDRQIDLLLTDIRMPQMNGWELAARLTALRPTLKVAYMSGVAVDPRSPNSAVDEPSDFLSKPFTRAAMLLWVRRMLDSAPRHS